jgi:hypothetical protein
MFVVSTARRSSPTVSGRYGGRTIQSAIDRRMLQVFFVVTTTAADRRRTCGDPRVQSAIDERSLRVFAVIMPQNIFFLNDRSTNEALDRKKKIRNLLLRTNCDRINVEIIKFRKERRLEDTALTLSTVYKKKKKATLFSLFFS